jgi:hypothetical protein
MWHWKTLQTFISGNRFFNQHESGELPRKCGLNAAYRIIYCTAYNPAQSIQPNIVEVGRTDMLMMFHATLYNNKYRVGMDTICQGPGFLA